MQASASGDSFDSTDGTKLFYTWTSSVGPARASVVVVHGYGEHSGRYGHVAGFLADAGFGVLTFDYRGHGRAGGRRGHCARFTEFLGDLERACALARRQAPDLPVVLLAHSHGALIVLRALCQPGRTPAGVAAAALSSPFLGLAMKVPALKVAAGKIAGRVWPTLALPNGIQAKDVSHDPSVVAAYATDSLTHHVATSRWFTEATAAQAYVAENAAKIAVPTLWLIAGADPIADPAVSRGVAARAGGDTEIHVYDGLYHELFNELPEDRARVLKDLAAWLDKRFPQIRDAQRSPAKA